MTGEYVIHADPDDWVEPTMLQELYAKAVAEAADVVICDYYVDTKKKTSLVKQQPASLDAKNILKELFQQLHGSCCNKLVKRACYNKVKACFSQESIIAKIFFFGYKSTHTLMSKLHI